jgi:regulator of protease activity HflC (stomatin/prohibitin superfamily)
MFDKLIDFVLNQINNIIPFVFIMQFQTGVKYRCGKYIKVLESGPHWKFPYIETVLKDNTVDTTMLLPAQSIVTEDLIEVVVKTTVGYTVVDIDKFFNKVYDSKSALADRSCVIVRNTIAANEYKLIQSDPISFNESLTEQVQDEVKEYGIKINFVALIDFTKSRSYRLFNEQTSLG